MEDGDGEDVKVVKAEWKSINVDGPTSIEKMVLNVWKMLRTPLKMVVEV